MYYSIDAVRDEEYRNFIEVADVKFGITNQIIRKNQRLLIPPPALVVYGRNGGVVYRNEWMPSLTPISNTFDWIWREYEEQYSKRLDHKAYIARYGKWFTWSDLQFFVNSGGLHYKGSWSYVTAIGRNEVSFLDGSVVTGDLAQALFLKYEEMMERRIHYVAVKDGVFKKYDDLQGLDFIDVYPDEVIEENERSSGSGSLMLSDYTLPIINRTPFVLRLAKGYSTVACGWASAILSHPGYTLRQTYDGDARSFTVWRERSTKASDTGTVLEYDAAHNELVQWRKK